MFAEMESRPFGTVGATKVNIEEKMKGHFCEDGKKAGCDGRRFLLHFLIGFSFNSIFNSFCFITSYTIPI